MPTAPIADYSKVTLLLPMSGANSGQVFTDYSPSARTISLAGNVITSTAQSQFYGSSAYFDGVSGYLQCNPVAASLVGASAFTIEGWVCAVSRKNSQPALFGIHDSGGGNRLFVADYYVAGSSFPTTIFTQLTLGAWHHVAVVRASTLRVYINGVFAAQSTPTRANDINSFDLFSIGQEFDFGPTPSDFFNGYMQDICVTIAEKYTGNFTPPSKMMGSISVETRDASNLLVPRKVFAVPRSLPSKVYVSGTTDANGVLTLANLPACEYSVVALANGDALPDLVLRRLPA